MSKVNVKLAGASYSDVPAVILRTPEGAEKTFVETSDATADATDVLAGKTFYGADGKLVTGVHTGEIYNTNKDVNIYSDAAWKVDVKQVAHQTITATPRMEWNEEGDGRYRAHFYTYIDDIALKTDIGYLPGVVTQNVDASKYIITVSSTDAELIEPLVKDGWKQVVFNDAFRGNCFTDTNGNQLSDNALTGKLLAVDGSGSNIWGWDGQYGSSYSLSSLTSVTDFRDDYVTQVGMSPHDLAYLMDYCSLRNWTSLEFIQLSNLQKAGNYFLDNCPSLKTAYLGQVQFFGSALMSGCTSLETIKLLATTPPTLAKGSNNEDWFRDVPATCQLYVPASAVNSYRADSIWGTKFKDRIFAIEETT